ncbi:GNAT family N-acetyltransferase [Mesorhizobium sp. M00.F.Ca.ET.186.01.1.1]|nr:GNAT family N-acetyltransferase [bacterium M00.F.Ca.ET.205.01.1.1]TGU48202.1 GNAT family N-acetyltransferase [bacterium M00.F.Ca.ET.152.01.1.1]TGV32440.1 GNAT family N-acetyltransferase [Mesorhizobium sp. M00.F.Ca.ET.186.01.1.1]TGZ39653.1 GNAT family N-acetyltransferase [bacterium M00.F.Ca.ET.162.01.1.1]TIW62921.1 MAG: GNAT family N-acetyltransferase [Mesorhizobium sp.]
MTGDAGVGSRPVVLEPVGKGNRAAILALELSPEQRGFVASNAESLAEARQDDEAIARAVVAAGRVVGFLMYSAPDDDDEATIYRFMIDRREQGKGRGRAAVAEALKEIARLSHIRRVSICYEPENEAARRLYASFGFAEKGLDEDGEMIAVLELGR